ncbi:hypothetical protein M758_12G102800 [Ceratodon purpureus]|nr:hypothetical protein M758_12G102800 [Ceratodon purpureus]
MSLMKDWFDEGRWPWTLREGWRITMLQQLVKFHEIQIGIMQVIVVMIVPRHVHILVINTPKTISPATNGGHVDDVDLHIGGNPQFCNFSKLEQFQILRTPHSQPHL